ncbi:class I SAM-dependent methyltransferase [Nisaea acidiphila]|uniref:Class I SAM-dependent methyltransferase n=1 Tax=Nisaea acidiphila TaxID=1862145 RepID=A0A9J7AVA1_9PROT|nr:class I SAM-dependent methyltransferase [Nisaea acidiphila]UUX51263.1 class I SAM-dependent methyltransferase [Nisaea acidiphila]
MTANPLSEHLRKLIARNGPLTVARYMEEALLHPEHGYYTGREPFGRQGDFITAPEVSQVFGELTGLWCAAAWQQMGSPGKIALVEFGPGRGTLMADALRATRIVPGFADALDIHLVEASPRLRELQRETLAGVEVTWHETPDTLPARSALMIGNEFFDALPIRQLVFRADGWKERCIGWDDKESRFVWTEQPAEPGLAALVPASAGHPHPGAVFEISIAARDHMSTIAAHLAAQGGTGLFIDYGHGRSAYGDTFQAVRAHRPVDVLDAPGSADLTAHVDFDALQIRAHAAGCTCFGTITQGNFLTALGLEARTEQLLRNATDSQAAALRSGARRLIEPAEMGTLFKVIAVAAPDIDELPGFGPPRDLART